MKPEAQRIAIAGECGWTVSQHGWWSHPVLPDNGGAEPEPPDYLNDLNAMHEAEKVLNAVGISNYAHNLIDVMGGLNENGDAPNFEYFKIAHATAAQRAEAFLRTLNLWDE